MTVNGGAREVMADSDFGDFSSAFPNSEAGEGSNVPSCDTVFEKSLPDGTTGAQLPPNDDFSMDWGFQGFQSFPAIPFSPSTLGTLPDIPPLPEDLQFSHGADDIAIPGQSATFVSQQMQLQVGSATAPITEGNIEFGDFEYSTELHMPQKDDKPKFNSSSDQNAEKLSVTSRHNLTEVVCFIKCSCFSLSLPD